MNNDYGLQGINLSELYDLTDKENCVKNYILQMLNKTQSMFKYENLPDTIPKKMFELYLQTNGNCVVTEVDNKLYCFTGGLGGKPDEYYRPTIYTIANPYLKISKSLKINEDCVLVYNDSMWQGVLPIYRRYATQLVENDLSLYLADVNTRIISLISANDDRTKKSADIMLDNILKGKLGIIAETPMLDSIKTLNFNNGNNNIIQSLIEYQQYIKGSWYNELGLNANYNMKRETLTTTETQLNSDALLPLIDDMLNSRKQCIELINKKYGTNIKVELDSSWLDNQEELELEHDIMNNEADNVSDDVDNSEEVVDDDKIE